MMVVGSPDLHPLLFSSDLFSFPPFVLDLELMYSDHRMTLITSCGQLCSWPWEASL